MPVPCKAKCMNQNRGQCQLEDERVMNNQVEFGEDWDPMENCSCFAPREGKQPQKKSKKKKNN